MESQVTNIKEIKSVILDIFERIDEICKNHNLKYFAIGGTCLGAVRHGGFIPWDDDLDVAMPREDYERFKRIAAKQLPDNLKIFDVGQGTHYTCYFMKVHNTDTTFIEKGMSVYPDRYTGVYVDIMPLDGIPSGNWQKKLYFMKLRNLMRLDWHRKNMFHPVYAKEEQVGKNIVWKLVNFFIKRLPDNYFSDKYVQLQKSYSYDNSRDLCYTWSKRAAQVIFPKSDFEDYVLLPFEDTKIRCPVGYDNFLTVLFGDYRKLPPKEQRVPCHNTDMIDLERPYTYYMKEDK